MIVAMMIVVTSWRMLSGSVVDALVVLVSVMVVVMGVIVVVIAMLLRVKKIRLDLQNAFEIEGVLLQHGL